MKVTHNNKECLNWSDIPMQYKLKLNEIDDDVIKNIYSKFSFKYYKFNESKNFTNAEENFVLFVFNYLIKYKFIIFHLTNDNNIFNINPNSNIPSRVNCVICIEGECIIIEQIKKSLLDCIISKLHEKQISIINVGKNPNHEFNKKEIEAKEEIQSFRSYFEENINKNFFVSNTIDSIIGYLIRRYYFQSSYFNDSNFFYFDESNLIEHEIKNKINDCVYSEKDEKNTITKIEKDITEIRKLEDNFKKYEFNMNDFIELRTLYAKTGSAIYLVIHIKSLHLFCMKKLANPVQNDENNHEINFSNSSHRCFVRCYGLIAEDDKTIGLIYEFMSNGNLNSYIKNNDDDIEDVFLFTTIIRIVTGIENLQKNQQIHRDLKPSNILIDHDYLPYISDFETVKSISTEKTNTNDIGSPLYSSPEQDEGLSISYPTDIYSFGLIIYFLFEKKDMFEIFSNKKINKKMTKGPSIIQYIYDRCVEYNQERRITCNEIKTILNDSLYFYDNYFMREKDKINRTQLINFIFESKINQEKIESLKFHSDRIQSIYNLIYLKFKNNIPLLLLYLGNFYANIEGEKQDYLKAIEYYERSAKLNNSDAIYNLGNLYEIGNGVHQSYLKAIEYFERSAKLNNSKALFKFGLFYEEGKIVEQDYFKAIEYYKKSAKLNNSDALNNLGNLYAKGECVTQDFWKAIEYYEKSAEFNNHFARVNLTFLYLNFEEIKQNSLIANECYNKLLKFNDSSIHYILDRIYKEEEDDDDDEKQDTLEATEFYEQLSKINEFYSLNDLGNLYAKGEKVKQDYKKAIEYYEKSAKLNNSDALNNLGFIYSEGYGVQQDYKKAIEYYEQSVKLNNSDALFNLGVLYAKGEKVKQDYKKAIEYFERSAKLNNSKALFNLGVLYEKGYGVQQDYKKAIEYYEQSAKLNNSAALFNLGVLYEKGKNIQQDYKKAIEYFERSAKLKNSDALNSLGFIYSKGYGVQQDYKKAIEYFERSAKLNNSYALNNLGGLYELGEGVKRDYSKAIEYYEESAKLNNSYALDNLGLLYEKGEGVKRDYMKAAKYYEKSAKTINNSFSLYKLGIFYKNGYYYKKDYSKAKEYFEKSADLNNSEALICLGDLYESGFGVEQSYEIALKYYKKSSLFNNSDAFLRIGKFYFKGYEVNRNYLKAIQNYELSSYLNNSLAHFVLGDIYSNSDVIESDFDKAIKYFKKSIDIQTGLITTKHFDGKISTEYKTNNHRYISHNDIGLIYLIEKKETNKGIDNIKESAFAEYPFGQNNFGLINEFYLNEKGNAKYMYKRSSKHNFALSEFNLGRMFESENKKKESIEYFILASEHEDEPLLYREITREDKRLEISKKFIICLTNLKLFVHFYSKDDRDESKKYFNKAFNNLTLNSKDFNYQFKFKIRNQQEYSNDLFSYLKKFIFNFPLFNLINQPNLDIKSYSHIFEQNKDENDYQKVAMKTSENDQREQKVPFLFENVNDSNKYENNFSSKIEGDKLSNQYSEKKEKESYFYEKKQNLSINEIDTNKQNKDNNKHKTISIINSDCIFGSDFHDIKEKEYYEHFSGTNKKENNLNEKKHLLNNEITKINVQNIEDVPQNKNEHFEPEKEIKNPSEFFDFVFSSSNSNSELKSILIKEIKSIIDIMNEILYTPPYPILFGHISISKPKEKVEFKQRSIDESFYAGFGTE